MILFTVVSAIAGLNVGNYTFAVEDLMLNGSSYSLPVSNEATLYFNLLAPVDPTTHCGDYNGTGKLSAYTVEGLDDTDLCFPVALNGTEEIGLIQKNPRAAPTGLFINYSEHTGSAGNMNITLNCNRVSNVRGRQVGPNSYYVQWNHPAGCARAVRQKSKFTGDMFM